MESKRADNINMRYVSKLSDRIKQTFADEEVRKKQLIVNHVRKSENITRKSLDLHWNKRVKESQDNYLSKLHGEALMIQNR